MRKGFAAVSLPPVRDFPLRKRPRASNLGALSFIPLLPDKGKS